jgi:AraC-like DNA-binding protein
MIGDHIDSFEESDLILLGPYTPHEWLIEQPKGDESAGVAGECIVIQFLPDFLGPQFLDIPENKALKKVLLDSSRGIKFPLNVREKITRGVKKIVHLPNNERLYCLFSIFQILSRCEDYEILCSPGFMEPFHSNDNIKMQKALQYIHQNFQKEANIKGVLDFTQMSNTAFCNAFKKSYRMTFKKYLLNVRIGYACNLLADGSLNISEIAYSSGFENISNFNRQFKKLKNITPSQYKKAVQKF